MLWVSNKLKFSKKFFRVLLELYIDNIFIVMENLGNEGCFFINGKIIVSF